MEPDKSANGLDQDMGRVKGVKGGVSGWGPFEAQSWSLAESVRMMFPLFKTDRA